MENDMTEQTMGRDAWIPLLEELVERDSNALQMGGVEKLARRHVAGEGETTATLATAAARAALADAGVDASSIGLIVLATAHDAYRCFDFRDFTIPLVDTRNAVAPEMRPAKYFKA